PDAVVRKSGQGGVPANWLRLWVAPFRYRGQLVFLAQAGRPIGGRFQAARGGELRLHPNVDEARDILIQDMLYSGGLERLGFANGVGAAAAGKPRDSLDGTRYFTDGLRAAMFFVTRPRSVSSVEMLDWVPYSQPRDSATRAMNDDAQN
ncbi:MAG: LssY C-terminal domain-containing protein, partial [Gammaproteobacteria bacterium]